ncbi:DUF979 domain-containing protein [Psychromonas sp. KJ10-10]|uniref:DUF979 domain-containing protein n=1 Tax=Psychromonas sp. KJ10-10 TaxID=3391823 RepID=UPI0039B55F0E
MLEYIYQAVGLLIIVFSVQTFLDKSNSKRIGTGLFWLIYGSSLCLGKVLPDWLVGIMIIVLTLLVTFKLMGSSNNRQFDVKLRRESSEKLKNKLFLPALVIPIITIFWSKFTGTSTLIGLGISFFIALLIALFITKGKASQSVNEGRRLIDSIGWAVILPQFLVALGYLFGEAGVGETVSQIVKEMVPQNNTFAYVLCYTFGMALFTVIMGNAFAAFAVITTGIAIPLLIVEQSGNPAIIGVIGMLSGYCGTLMTPMARNFNIVPATLLELKNKYQIIHMQLLPAFCMLSINTCLIYFLAF